MPLTWPRWSARSRPPGSPSGARPAPTTACRRPPWRTARSRGTSEMTTTYEAAPARRSQPRGIPQTVRHDLLRLATAGSVDDGKSTLVGRLLHDTKSVLADQLDAVERV